MPLDLKQLGLTKKSLIVNKIISLKQIFVYFFYAIIIYRPACRNRNRLSYHRNETVNTFSVYLLLLTFAEVFQFSAVNVNLLCPKIWNLLLRLFLSGTVFLTPLVTLPTSFSGAVFAKHYLLLLRTRLLV